MSYISGQALIAVAAHNAPKQIFPCKNAYD